MDFRQTAKTSFSWSLLIQLSTQVLNFIVSVILARLLFPEDFGIIGIVAIFMNISKTLIDGGLASSLIRSKDVDDEDYSSVFIINLVSSLFLYALIFSLSPVIAEFFNQKSLVLLLRVYGLVILIGAFSIVQSVRLNRNMQFKTQFKLQIPSLFISAVISVWMARNGFGVWSLVFKEIIFALISSILLWHFSKWRPTMNLNGLKLRSHWRFGSKLLITEIFSSIFSDFYKVVLGKFFNLNQLGLFTRAKSLQELPTGIIFNAVNRVMFPLLSSIQDQENKLKSAYRQIISIVTYVVVPFLSLMAIVAEPLIVFLLTDKWIDALPFFQILVIAGIITPIQAYLLNICKVKGRSDLVLKIAFYEYVLIFLSIIPSFWLGIYWLLWSIVIVAVVKTVVTGLIAGKLINYSFREQLEDIFQPFLLSILSSIIALLFIYLVVSSNGRDLVWNLLIPSLIFFLSYFLFSNLFGNSVFGLLKSYVKNKV